MAYVDFSVDAVRGAPLVADRLQPVPAAAGGLSALEWSVVALARNDRLSSLRDTSRLAVVLGAIFGPERRSLPLADPKLEALRRMAVLTWRRGVAVPAHEVAAFLGAGFTAGQYDTLLASIGTAQPAGEVRA